MSAGFGPLVKDHAASRAFYVDALGLPLELQSGIEGYYHSEKLDGVRHFALWPLSEAARSCFGVSAWPADVPEPHSWLEFDVEDVRLAADALKSGDTNFSSSLARSRGDRQSRACLALKEILVGLTFTPWLR